MGEVRFLESYRFRELLRQVRDGGILPPCQRHPMSPENVCAFLETIRDKTDRVDESRNAWVALSFFAAFYFQQPVCTDLELLHEVDFSRYVSQFLPTVDGRAKHDVAYARSLFDVLVDFFDFLTERGAIQTSETIRSARSKIFMKNRIVSLRRGKLRGSEWATVRVSPATGQRLVFSFNDIWLLLALKIHFEGNLEAMKAHLDDPYSPIHDKLQKRAHLARLVRRIEQHGICPVSLIRGMETQSMMDRCLNWLESDPFVPCLAES